MNPQNAPGIDVAALTSAIESAVADPASIDALSGGEPQEPAVEGGVAPPPADVTLDDGSQVSVGGDGGVAPQPPPTGDTTPPAHIPTPAPGDPALTPPSPSDLLANQPRVDPRTGESMGAPQFQAPEQPAASPGQPAAPQPESAPAPADPEPPAPDITRIYELVLGRPPTADDVIQQVDLVTRISALPPTHQQFINAVMSGQVDPEEYVRAIEEMRQPRQPRPAPDPDDPWADDDPDPRQDPRLSAEYQQLERQRAELERAQAQMEQQRTQQIRAGSESAWKEFRDAHPDWSPEEIQALQVHVNNSPLFGPLYSQTGDARAAVSQTITNTAIQLPYFRDKLMSESSPATSPQRQNAAAALASNGQGSGGGGRPVAGPTPPPGVAAQQLQQVNPAAATGNTPQQPPQPVQQPAAPPVQQPVQPVVSPFTSQPSAPEIDLHDKSQVTLAMARQIAELTGGG